MKKIYPEIDNQRYTGSLMAKWSLLPIFAFTLVRSLLHIFLKDGGAQSIATIPLSSFSLEAQGAVIQIFGLWGLSQLITVLFEMVLFMFRDDFIPFI